MIPLLKRIVFALSENAELMFDDTSLGDLAGELSSYIHDIEAAEERAGETINFYRDFLKEYGNVLYLNNHETTCLRVMLAKFDGYGDVSAKLRRRLLRSRENTVYGLKDIERQPVQGDSGHMSKSRKKQNSLRRIKGRSGKRVHISSTK